MAAFTFDSIPPISAILLSIMQFDPGKPESDAARLDNLIGPDKAISARLLKVANSALYGRSGKIKTLREAITLLGLKATKNLVVMLATQAMHSKLKDPMYRRYLQEFPVLTALVAMDVCGPANRRQHAETVFLSGLLSTIGMSVVAMNKPDHYSVLLASSDRDPKMKLVELERQSYRTDHVDVGLMVCDAWKLPAEFREVMTHRNAPVQKAAAASDTVQLACLADAISRRLLVIPDPRGSGAAEQALAHSLGIPPEKMTAFGENYFTGLQDHPFYQQAVSG